MYRHYQDTGQILVCQVKDNGQKKPMTILLGDERESMSISYSMEWPRSVEFRFNANLEWLKTRIKNMRGIK